MAITSSYVELNLATVTLIHIKIFLILEGEPDFNRIMIDAKDAVSICWTGNLSLDGAAWAFATGLLCRSHICRWHVAYNVCVFGSVARPEEFSAGVFDLLVEMESERSLLDLGGLLMDLQEPLGCRVDIAGDHRYEKYPGSSLFRPGRRSGFEGNNERSSLI